MQVNPRVGLTELQRVAQKVYYHLNKSTFIAVNLSVELSIFIAHLGMNHLNPFALRNMGKNLKSIVNHVKKTKKVFV